MIKIKKKKVQIWFGKTKQINWLYCYICTLPHRILNILQACVLTKLSLIKLEHLISMQRNIMPINISIPIIEGERGDQEQGEKRRGEEDGEHQNL